MKQSEASSRSQRHRAVGLCALFTAIATCCSIVGVTSATAQSSTQGVTAKTILLGAPTIDYEKLKDFGVKIDRGDPQKIYDALAAAVNERGGINGRDVKIETVKYDIVNPASAEASCVRLTEDLKVFAVIDTYPPPADSAGKCVIDHKVPWVGNSPDPAIAAKTPWISANASDERSMALFAQLLGQKGVFKGKKVGVVTDTAQAAKTKKVLVPALKKVGAAPKVVLVDDAPAGDTAAVDANWDVFAEKLKSEGVNHVVLVGSEAVGGFTRVLDHNLDVKVSSPSTDNLASITKSQIQHPPSDYDGAITIGGPSNDERSPEYDQCLQDFKKANPSIEVKPPEEVKEGETDWAVGIIIACNQLRLFETVADKAGKNLTNASLLAAIKATTSNFALPSSPYNTFGPKKFDANNAFRIYVYDHTVGETGGLRPQGKLVDLASSAS